MNIAINCIIPNEASLNDDDTNHIDHINDDNTNNGELYDAFSGTFELTVSPQYDINENNKNNKKLQKKSSEIQQKICEQRIQSILKEILKNIRQDAIASNGRAYDSPLLPPPLFNYKILRFHNKASIDYGAVIDKIEWEWYECKTRPHFSYSMIKCDTKERKNKIFKLLQEKQREEQLKMNRILAEDDIIGALLSDTNNGRAINLRWDVIELQKCSYPQNIPHRVEDESILLINGKHIERDIKLPGNDKNVTRRAISLPPTATSKYKTFKELLNEYGDKLCRSLCVINEYKSDGNKIKKEIDDIIDRCQHLQNMRECGSN